MMLFFLTFSSLIFAQESLTIYRVEPKSNVAVVAYRGNDVRPGDLFKIGSGEEACSAPVDQVLEGFFYLNTEKCAPVEVQKGVIVSAVTSLPPTLPIEAATSPVNNPIAYTPPAATQQIYASPSAHSDFYNKFIASKLSLYVSYLAGSNLDGNFQTGSQTTVSELSGANTVGFGAEYKVAQLPHSLSVAGGLSYNLPRAYGKYMLNNQTLQFAANPELQLWSLYGNLRYHFNSSAFAYFGLNYLVPEMSNLPGSTTGDFGFHIGARYYLVERFFVDGALDMYNLNYSFQGAKSDIRLTELELKAGFAF